MVCRTGGACGTQTKNIISQPSELQSNFSPPQVTELHWITWEGGRGENFTCYISLIKASQGHMLLMMHSASEIDTHLRKAYRLPHSPETGAGGRPHWPHMALLPQTQAGRTSQQVRQCCCRAPGSGHQRSPPGQQCVANLHATSTA
jgi:hypothetical protein